MYRRRTRITICAERNQLGVSSVLLVFLFDSTDNHLSSPADLQPQTTDPSMLSASNAPVRTGSGSKRVRPPLPSPMTLASSNEPGTSNRSRQNASPEASFVRTDPVDRNASQSSSRAPAQYSRVDSKPLQDLEDILDSFAYNTRGEKHPSSANSSSNSSLPNISPTKQRAPAPNHIVTPSQGSSLDFGNSDAETQVVRKVSLRRSPSNPIRLETLRDQQQSNHNSGNQRRTNGNSPPRSSNSSPSYDHSLDSAASSASPATPRDHQHNAFSKDHQYQQQQNYPPSHLYAPRTQADQPSVHSIGLVPDYDQRYSKSPRRSAIESIYGSYNYDDDDEDDGRAVA